MNSMLNLVAKVDLLISVWVPLLEVFLWRERWRSMLPLKGYTENILSHNQPALTIISFILPHPTTINHTLSSDNIKLEAGKSGSLYDLHHVNSKILQVVPLPLVPHSWQPLHPLRWPCKDCCCCCVVRISLVVRITLHQNDVNGCWYKWSSLGEREGSEARILGCEIRKTNERRPHVRRDGWHENKSCHETRECVQRITVLQYYVTDRICYGSNLTVWECDASHLGRLSRRWRTATVQDIGRSTDNLAARLPKQQHYSQSPPCLIWEEWWCTKLESHNYTVTWCYSLVCWLFLLSHYIACIDKSSLHVQSS